MNIIDLKDTPMLKMKATSSKGNQPKWIVRNTWVKADYMGYEGLSEVVTSGLIECSNVKEFVKYGPVKLKYGGKTFNGCYSKNFRTDDKNLITLERLSMQYLGHSIIDDLVKIPDTKDKIKYTVDFIERVTGLKGVGPHLTLMLELDAFFLNEDRHTHNIAFVYDDKTNEFTFCPFFDFGLSLLSDTTGDYKLTDDVYKLIDSVPAKPFSMSFDEQVEAAEILYGQQLYFNFTQEDIDHAFLSMDEYYDEETIRRVRHIIGDRMRVYGYFFKKEDTK